MSADLGVQAIGLPVQSSERCKWRWDADSEKDIISLSLKQQQPLGSILAFLSARVSLCCVFVGYVSRLVAAR